MKTEAMQNKNAEQIRAPLIQKPVRTSQAHPSTWTEFEQNIYELAQVTVSQEETRL